MQVKAHSVFNDWYEWYWSESSYFLSTRLSFGWLSESNPGFSLLFYCQTAGWLVLWKSGVGSSLVLPDKGVRPNRTPTANPSCHLVCFLLACSHWTTPGCCPTTTFLPQLASLWSITSFATAPCCKASLHWYMKICWLVLVNIRASEPTMQSTCSLSHHWLQRDQRPHRGALELVNWILYWTEVV